MVMSLKKLYNLLLGPFSLISKNRRLLFQTVFYDVHARFSGSVLGLFWLFLQPVMFLAVYAIVYLLVFKVRFQLFDADQYVVVIFCGLIPFLGFAEALSMGLTSVSANVSLIKNTLYPVQLIPVKSVLTTQLSQLVGSVLLFFAVIVVQGLTVWVLMWPLLWVFQLMFMIGIVWILSSLNVYLKDLQYLISTIILMLMMISPIAYPIDMLPENLRAVVLFNPVAHMIICYQDILMIGRFPGIHFWIFFGFSVFIFYVGYVFFKKMKNIFVDNI